MEQGLRLWRARRRHDRIDVVLRSIGTTWVLEYIRNDRPMFMRRYETEMKARADVFTFDALAWALAAQGKL